MENCCVEFDPESLRPTFRLSYGLPGKSNALETAREIGLPKPLLERAHHHLGEAGSQASEIIGKLQEELTRLQRGREELEEERKALESARHQYVRKLDRAEDKAREEIEQIHAEWKEFRSMQEQSLQQALSEAKAAESAQKARARMSESRKARDQQFQELKLHRKRRRRPEADDSPLAQEQAVKLIGLDQPGMVLRAWSRADGPNVAVEVAGKRLSWPRGSLARVSGKSKRPSSRGSRIRVVTESRAPKAELNLIGKKVSEALDETDKFIDEALLHNLTQVRIIHGRGTGALRKAIAEHLESQPHIVSWQPAEPSAGGDAVTVVGLSN
jgi:DNA mismatch repair protein MutS2